MDEGELRIKDKELDELLADIAGVYKYDFTGYSRESLRRRVNRIILVDKFPSLAELRYHVLQRPEYFERFVEELTVNVTEMFRDPTFYRALQQEVFPVLARQPFIRIWHAGCSTGEEVYSMAILLKEAGLLDKALLYGTDLNPKVIEKAKAGIFHIAPMKLYSENYIKSGGKDTLSNYYTVRYGQALFDEALRKRMVYSVHNLVTDQSFNEFHLILCRNVLIYFKRELQNRVFSLFTESLSPQGFLALGAKESLLHSPYRDYYNVLNKEERIWVKK